MRAPSRGRCGFTEDLVAGCGPLPQASAVNFTTAVTQSAYQDRLGAQFPAAANEASAIGEAGRMW
jgi:hypothetical protein